MKALYRNDEGAGPGHGILEFSEALIPDGPWSLSLRRASDHLHASGKAAAWTPENVFIPLPGEVGAGGTLVLKIGPDIVDGLDPQDQYMVSLKGGDGEALSARLRLGPVIYSPSESLNYTARGERKPEAAPEKPAEKAAPEKTAARPEPAAAPAAPLPEGPAPLRRKAGIWRYVILALLALGCLAWYLIDPGRDKPEEQPRQSAANAPERQPAQNTPSAEDETRQFFNGLTITPQAAAELARRLPKNTDADKDAVYRLYYFAAENGERSVLMDFAACLDPSLPAWGSIQKDAPAAMNAYRDAESEKIKGAAEARAHLLAWLKQKSAGGDAKAREWLSQIP